MSVVEECMYVGLSLVYGARGHKLKAEIERGLEDVARLFLESLGLFLEEFEVEIVDTPTDAVLLSDLIQEYGLLPNDALIAATCKHHGIKEIASFDEDFKRVNFLKIVKP